MPLPQSGQRALGRVFSPGPSVPGSGCQGPFCTVKGHEGNLEGLFISSARMSIPHSVYYTTPGKVLFG